MLQNIREMEEYAPLTQRSVLKEILPHTSSSSESEFGLVRISDLFPRRSMVSEITKTDSFEFGPMKEEIEYTSTQMPGKGTVYSQKTTRTLNTEPKDQPRCSNWVDDDVAIERISRNRSGNRSRTPSRSTTPTRSRTTSKSRSLIYVDKVENKIKIETECITINDSSDNEETYVETKPILQKNTGWYQRYHQELEERERRGELTPPRTTRPISSIKITKLNKNSIVQDPSQENSLTPTQLLYPPSFEKDFLGSQNDINFIHSCLEAEQYEKQDDKRRIKPSPSTDDIRKSKKLKKVSFDDIYDDEVCKNDQKQEENRSLKIKFDDDELYDDEASDD